jgi:hypothetical protein
VSAWGALGDATTRSLSPALALTESDGRGRSRRGALAVAVGADGRLVTLARGRDEPCAEGRPRACATFRFRELSSTGPVLRGLPLRVPAPCPRALAGHLVIGGRSHYGFCSERSGRPEVTAFMRQTDPFYVGVSRPAPGCVPLGATAIRGDAVFVFQCGDQRRGIRLGGLGAPEREVDLTDARLECALGRPRLSAAAGGSLLDLAAPKSDLGVLLPTALGGPLARAAWTGSALLVATWVRGRVILRRWECRGPELSRTG